MSRLGFASVPGRPIPKARPRVVVDKTDGRLHAYTPKQTRDYEDAIGWSWHGERLYEGPVSMTIIVQEDEKQHPADLDNYIKVASDALNGIAFKDDRQVVHVDAKIERKTAHPGLVVTVEQALGVKP